MSCEVLLDQPAEHLDALARLHEADRARAVAHEPREQLGGLAERRAARPERRRRSAAGSTSRCAAAASGEPSRSIRRDVLQAGQALGELDRVGDRRGGQQEARLGAVGGRDPPQPAQDVGRRASRTRRGRRAPRRSRRPRGSRTAPPRRRGWGGCRRAACRGWSARRSRCGGSGRAPRAACRRRRSPGARAWSGRTPPAHAPGPARAPWSGTGTARARAAVAAEHVERRQVEAQRLARGGARSSRSSGPPRPRLQRLAPGGSTGARRRMPRERREHVRVQLRGRLDEPRPPGALARLAHEPPVLAAGVQQRAPRLGSAVGAKDLR